MNRRIKTLSAILGALVVVVALVATRAGPRRTAAPASLDESRGGLQQTTPPTAAGERLEGGFGDVPLEDATRRNPFGNGDGEAVDLAQAEQETGFNAPQPHTDKANQSLLTKVYVEVFPDEEGSITSTTAVNHLAMLYSSGVMITVSMFSTLTSETDPAKYYERLSAPFVAEGQASIETIQDLPAMVIPPTDAHLGSVDIVWKGLRVTIYGQAGEISVDELVQIADSLGDA